MKPKNEATGDLNGFLDAGSQIEGELRFEDTFRIDGHLNGKVSSKGDLIVGTGGHAEGEIRVGRLYVSGTVRGSVQALQRIEIAAGAKVEADVETPALVIEEGARFQGHCAMEEKTRQRSSGTAPAGDRPWADAAAPSQ